MYDSQPIITEGHTVHTYRNKQTDRETYRDIQKVKVNEDKRCRGTLFNPFLYRQTYRNSQRNRETGTKSERQRDDKRH